MKFLPANVRGTYDNARGYGYVVTLPDRTEEWYRLAWQATARAHGWTPPPPTILAGHYKAPGERPPEKAGT